MNIVIVIETPSDQKTPIRRVTAIERNLFFSPKMTDYRRAIWLAEDIETLECVVKDR